MSAPLCPRLLDGLSGPADVRALAPAALPGLAAEIRRRLVETVQRTGGHLGPNLGVVELTIAVHRVFDSPRDAIVWDTGHQAYVHKLLTGRDEAFAGLRGAGGLSGYPSRAESAHDLVENSHASTALSYADGLAKAFRLTGRRDRAVVAVVGDGALTGGMCWEALNNIGGAPERPVVIVLNDNARSYSPTIGGLARHLRGLRHGEETGSLFERLGLHYIGPVPGHDIPAIEQALRAARAADRPVLVHCITHKGHGYAPAEHDQIDHLHALPPARSQPAGQPAPTWTAQFAAELLRLGHRRQDIVAVTAAMLHPTGLGGFATAFPDRVFDVGIAEQHAVTSAAGLAMGGLHPVVCLYATFLTRAIDQVLMDVALHRLPVTFILDRAGITGEDGPSHHGMWDLALLHAVPGLRVAAPRDAIRLRTQLHTALRSTTPTALRFPKGALPPHLPTRAAMGHADVLLRTGRGGTLLIATGATTHTAVAAARRVSPHTDLTVIDPGWLLPVDPALAPAAAQFDHVITIEDHAGPGGYGDALARTLRNAGCTTPVRSLHLGPNFIPHGIRASLLADHDLDTDGIHRAIRACGRQTRRNGTAGPEVISPATCTPLRGA
jgi:1-deoxy-D-xylulose-5-phosphate synthase